MRALGLILLVVACDRSPKVAQSAQGQPERAAQPSQPAVSTSGSAANPKSADTAPQNIGEPCGALNCRSFDSEQAAFEYVLRAKPRILAIGEAHAQKASEPVESATKRFSERLLPMLKNRASDVVIELLVADGSCKKQEQAVAEKQKPVTREQAATNQNEFVELGNQAKRMGMTPHALQPSCDDYQRIASAGANDLALMLELISQETERTVKSLLERRADSLIVTYGGALHNDIAPRPGRESWSFGPKLSEHTGGRYVELDLIVPEYVKDSEAWRALPWYPHFDRTQHGARSVVFEPNPGAFVFIFPSSKSSAHPPNQVEGDAAP